MERVWLVRLGYVGILAIHSEVGLSVFLHSQKQRKNLPLYLLQRLVTNGLKSFQVSQLRLYMYPAWPPDHSSLDSRPVQPQFQTMSDLTPDHSSLNSRPFQSWLQTIPASTPDHFSLLTPDHSSLNLVALDWDQRLLGIICLFGLCATELDACVEPVLSMEEAIQHPHNVCVNILESCSSSRREYDVDHVVFLTLSALAGNDTIFTRMMILGCRSQVSDQLQYVEVLSGYMVCSFSASTQAW